ncbi:MAG: hypothetical protein J0H99_19720, partial [Rhodospirillales bacterium]|nr:hypothetical protein [Rhodospirillales bacterium]
MSDGAATGASDGDAAVTRSSDTVPAVSAGAGSESLRTGPDGSSGADSASGSRANADGTTAL